MKQPARSAGATGAKGMGGINTEAPVGRLGRIKPSQRAALTRQIEERWARANRRYKIAKVVADTYGSREAKRAAVVRAMEAHEIPAGAIPSKSTITFFQKAWDAGLRSAEAFMDNPRPGRPRLELHPAFEARINDVLELGTGESAYALTVELKDVAIGLGVGAPSYHQVHARFAAAGRLKRSAARHGSKAGIVDAVAHGRVAARATHDVWALDELKMPVWAGVYSDLLGRFVSVRADIVLIIDLRSTFPVGWYIADPSNRLDENGDLPDGGFNSDDVLAALLSAACPELAPPSTRAGAGYLPSRLRWDNASAHKTLHETLKGAEIEIDARRIPKRQAFSNGGAEKPVDTLKKWCAGMWGHIDDFMPTDQIRKHSARLGSQRSLMAGSTSGRPTRKQPIEPDQLMSPKELAEAFDKVVYRYGHVHERPLFRMTAISRYRQQMRRDMPRRGRDLLRLLKPKTTVVTTEGIRHYAKNREYRYTAVVDNAILMVDTPVTYLADPVNRGIFVAAHNKLHFLEHEPSPDEVLATRMARSRTAVARTLSDRAETHRRADFVVKTGLRELARAEQSFETNAERVLATSDTEPVLVSTQQPMVDDEEVQSGDEDFLMGPWANPDPAASVRRRSTTRPAQEDDHA
jgi:hypothetical protein